MDAVKSAIVRGVQESHGPCVVQVESIDMCLKILVEKCPDHIIYVRPNDRHTQFMCHYVNRSDVARRLCGACIYRMERFDVTEPAVKMEYDDQLFVARRKRALAAEPKCVCGLDTELHMWRQRKAFQLVRVVVGLFFLAWVNIQLSDAPCRPPSSMSSPRSRSAT